MKSREALRVLAEVSESQWGMATSAQAAARGVSYMNLTRLAEAGDLVRLSHGVYRDAGAPSDEFEELRAAWLATDPRRLAYERLNDNPAGVVVSGESASKLHRIGDLRATRSEFTTPTRRQTQRADLHYRIRHLPEQDVTVREGLPVTTRERTIADLVEDRQDLTIVSSALRDATRQAQLDVDRLTELLNPLAERNHHRKGDGAALLDDLMRLAGLDLESLAKQVATVPQLGSLVAAIYRNSQPGIRMPQLDGLINTITKEIALSPATRASLSQITKTLAAHIAASQPGIRTPQLDGLINTITKETALSPATRASLSQIAKTLAAAAQLSPDTSVAPTVKELAQRRRNSTENAAIPTRDQEEA